MLKKLLISCMLLLFFFIPMFSHANANVSGVFLKDVKDQQELQLQKNESMTILQNIVVLPSAPYDAQAAGQMIGRLSHISPKILKALSKARVQMKLFSGKLTDEPAFSHLQGKKPKGWSKESTWDEVPGAGGASIAAAKIGASEKGSGHGSINLELHEIGHSIDNKVFNSLKDDPQFRIAWKQDVNQLFPNRDYFVNYAEEYFAEVFAMYYLNAETKETLKEKAPHTFQLLKKLEKNVSEINVTPHL